MNNVTRITWALNDYCSYQCDYCPTKFRGGGEPPETKDYLRLIELINSNYNSLGRRIEWTLDGGEPLDMNDIVTLIKACKSENNSLALHTSGGKLWMDWWAIQPNVDSLILTYHYWQQESLMNYIIELFVKNNKHLYIKAPVHPKRFDQDINRILRLEERHGIWVEPQVLYNHADSNAGMFTAYTDEQLKIMETPKPWLKNAPQGPPKFVDEKNYFEKTTWDERQQDKVDKSPSFTGKLCNTGIEYLYIGHQGWTTGSNCGNRPMGNIWNDGWSPPNIPHRCGMMICNDPGDQLITKFD